MSVNKGGRGSRLVWAPCSRMGDLRPFRPCVIILHQALTARAGGEGGLITRAFCALHSSPLMYLTHLSRKLPLRPDVSWLISWRLLRLS